MKVLTILQPWGNLIVEGKKHIETRRWYTDYRGPLLIHAGARADKFTFNQIYYDQSWRFPYFEEAGIESYGDYKNLPRGCIIGVVKLTGCVEMTKDYIDFIKNLCPAEYAFGYYRVGRYAWTLEEPAIFPEPIPAKGQQRLWNYEEELDHAGILQQYYRDIAKES